MMKITDPLRAARGVALALTLATSTALADPPPFHYCDIAIDFAVNGRTIAAPRVIAELGQPADITLGDEMHGWRFSIVADEPKTIHRVTAIPIDIGVYELVNGQSILRASPHFGVAPGQRADFDTIFADDGRKAHIALVANPRSDADVQAMKAESDSDGSGD